MKFYCRKTDKGFIPLYDSDLEEYQRLKMGADYEVEIKRPRNLLMHKKFFALLRLVFDNLPESLQDELRIYCVDDLLLRLKNDLGYCECHIIDGNKFLIPKSISFGSMNQDEFEVFYKRCCFIMRHQYLKGVTDEVLNDEIYNYL